MIYLILPILPWDIENLQILNNATKVKNTFVQSWNIVPQLRFDLSGAERYIDQENKIFEPVRFDTKPNHTRSGQDVQYMLHHKAIQSTRLNSTSKFPGLQSDCKIN